jgi:peptidoglycan hydrolase FlgJ
MIRPTQSASPISKAMLPSIEIPRNPGNHPGFGSEGIFYGKSDRPILSDMHTVDGDAAQKEPLREAFRDFVGQTLFGQMMSSMRSTVGKPAYFHGGRAEEVFSQQLDQVMVERISEASASSVADPMFELFNMQRSQ